MILDRQSARLPHLVAHLSRWVGRSRFVLRLGPAFAGVLLILATYPLGRALYRRKERLIAAGLLTVSVYALYHSQELRFYAWQMLISTLTLIFLLHGPVHRRWLCPKGGFHLNRWRLPEYLAAMKKVGFVNIGYEILDRDEAGLKDIEPRPNERFSDFRPDMLSALVVHIYGEKPIRKGSNETK